MNDYVKWLQETLHAMGYDPGPRDGLAGEHTAAAVYAFQREHDLIVDGIVGEYTNAALLEQLRAHIAVTPATATDTPDFAPDEFACSCGCGLDVVAPLKTFAQSLRNAFGWPLTISSGARCPTINREAGGVPDSCHLSGEAFDGYFAGHMDEAIIAQMAVYAIAYGIGVIRYPNQRFCHFQIYPRNDTIN